MTNTLSPTGKRVVESHGPLSASMVFIGESPAAEEVAEGIPFVGKAGKMLNSALRHAGIDRTQVRLMNVVPVRAPADNFSEHDERDVQFGMERFRAELLQLKNAKVYVALGANPTMALLGSRPPVVQRGERVKEGFIGEWRGSVLPVDSFKLNFVERVDLTQQHYEDYLNRLDFNPPAGLQHGAVVLPTFHPAAILRQYTWHPWLVMDLQRAAKIAREGIPPTKYRKWFIQDVDALKRLAASNVDLISVDTELEPWIVGLATEDEVHVFEWSEDFRQPLEALLKSDRIIKIAHNWTHDYAFFRKCLKITVARPLFDTQGGAHELNNALQKELSPHIATRFTNWPYHKWLTNHDQLVYCGMDAIVSFDAYWPQMEQLVNRGLYIPARPDTSMPSVSEFDHKLLTPLMEMQAVGFKINEEVRAKVEKELKAQLDAEQHDLSGMVQPIIDREIDRFEKPHLFRVERQCECCGGGKTQRTHCMLCGLGETVEPTPAEAKARGFKTAKAFKASFPPCRTCNATGKVLKKLDFNPDSSDQVADVVYRGLHIRPRKFKGNETVKAAQLDPLRDKHPIIAKLVDVSALRADYDTVSRLRAGGDGLLHCVLDPFGTGSGRVAGKEGLLEVGTNPMNLPLAARRFVVPRPGKIFLYPDMAQVEARAVAVLSGDKNLIDAFVTPINWPGHPKHGKIDSHTRVVQLMLGSGAQITRDQAKRLTYAAMYGARAAQLAVELNAEAFRKGQDLRLTTVQVQYMLDVFYKVFHGVRDWQKRVMEEVLATRRLRCPFTGRERTWLGYIVETRKKSPDYGNLKYEIAKQVWSFLPQNMGAWILGLGLIDIYYNSGEWGKLLQPLVHVHDALLIEAPIERVNEAKSMALDYLTRDAFGITFLAEMKTGMNWLEASGG